MKTEIKSFKEIEKELHSDYPNLTQYERLKLAVEIEKKEILRNGLAVSHKDDNAPALVAIALALGFGDKGKEGSINNTLKELVEINRIK